MCTVTPLQDTNQSRVSKSIRRTEKCNFQVTVPQAASGYLSNFPLDFQSQRSCPFPHTYFLSPLLLPQGQGKCNNFTPAQWLLLGSTHKLNLALELSSLHSAAGGCCIPPHCWWILQGMCKRLSQNTSQPSITISRKASSKGKSLLALKQRELGKFGLLNIKLYKTCHFWPEIRLKSALLKEVWTK